jgi:hypothetical protein
MMDEEVGVFPPFFFISINNFFAVFVLFLVFPLFFQWTFFTSRACDAANLFLFFVRPILERNIRKNVFFFPATKGKKKIEKKEKKLTRTAVRPFCSFLFPFLLR